MRTLVFHVPASRVVNAGGTEAEALVTIFDDGSAVLAFRPNPYCTWGPPIRPKVNESDDAPLVSAVETVIAELEGRLEA
jgi:hypothetical protein